MESFFVRYRNLLVLLTLLLVQIIGLAVQVRRIDPARRSLDSADSSGVRTSSASTPASEVSAQEFTGIALERPVDLGRRRQHLRRPAARVRRCLRRAGADWGTLHHKSASEGTMAGPYREIFNIDVDTLARMVPCSPSRSSSWPVPLEAR